MPTVHAYRAWPASGRQQLEHVNNNVEGFNQNLYDQATTLIQAQQETIRRRQTVVQGLGFKVRQPETNISDPQQSPSDTSTQTTKEDQFEWDVFICHASEDKVEFVRPLAERLNQAGLKVWFDEFSLTVGDSLRRSIDTGLVKTKFGVVVVSSNFFNKEWPQRELDGLATRERDGRKVILPVWLGVDIDDVAAHSPTLADRVAARADDGLEKVTMDLLRATQA